MPHKFLLLSLVGDGLGLALRLKQNGHTVAVNIRSKREKQNYDGLIEKVEKWEDFLDKDTIVVFDSSGGGRTADRLRARGHHVFAGSTFADNIEIDRELALELLEQAGVKIPPFKAFYSWEDGKKYVKQRGKKVVFKPTGEASHEPAIGSYVASTPDDAVMMLDYFETVAKKPPEFIIQDFIEGVAISTEGWFNGKTWMEPFNHTIEHKQMMNGDLGPSTGCACDIVWPIEQANCVLDEGLKLFGPTAARYEHVGLIDLNTIVNEEGVWALEFTPRFGYDSFPSTLELIEGDVGEVIAKMAMNEHPEEIELKKGFGSALRVSVPPHPSEQFVHEGGVPVQGLTRSDRPHLFLYEVRLDEQGRLVTSKGSGSVAAITGYDETIHGAFVGPNEIAKRLRVPEKQYRTDSEEVISNDFARLVRFIEIQHNQLKEVGGK